jgi:hypothetical protein
MDDAMTVTPIGVTADYHGLQKILRGRAEQLGLSRETIDSLAGFTTGHAAKLLAPTPYRRLGQMSLGAMLGALGLRLIVVEEEPETLEKLRARWVKRVEAQVRWRDAEPTLSIPCEADAERLGTTDEPDLKTRFFAALGALGGKRYAENTTPEQRAKAARRAARARWRKARATA